ncbi:Nuclear import receptor [Trebouxia sp. C0009 RCD-2024]
MMADQEVNVAAQRLSQALAAMHQPGALAEDRAAASSWLENFQQTALAWKVCEGLLQTSDQPYTSLLYAATALRNKIRKQLQTLPQDAWPGLRQTLANCINTHSASNQPVTTQLCIAMSALILQWTYWDSVLLDLGHSLSTFSMIMLLEYLPQEPSDPVYGKLMSGGAAYEWEAQSQYRVRPWSRDVIGWLVNVQLADIAPSDSQAQCRQLSCFAAWVRLGAIFEAESAQLDQLIQLAFQCTTSQNADENQVGSSALLDVLEFSPEELHLRFSDTMPQIAQAAVQAASAGDMDRAERLCTVFTHFCDFNMGLLGSSSQVGKTLRSALMQAALIPAPPDNEPTSGEAVAVGALSTCQYLAEHLQTPLRQDPDSPQETMSCEEGSSFFGQLLHGLLHNLQPVQVPGQPHLQSSPLREACKEVLAATCQLLGPEAFLQQVLGSVPGLGSHSASLDPKPLEAALFAIASAAEVLSRCIEGSEGADGPADEATAGSVADSLLHLLLHLSPATASLAHSRDQIRLLELLLMQTLAPALMRHLADHGAQAQELINFVLTKAGELLMQAGAEPRASMSAARAIVEVCDVAQSHDMPMPSNVLDGLLQLIQQTTDPDAEQELVVAFASCLSCIPMRPPAEPNRERYVQRLLHTLPVALQQLAFPGQLTRQQVDSANAAAVQVLQRTRTLMMFMQSWRDTMQQPEESQQNLSPAAQAFIGCWALSQQAVASGHASSAMQEGTAACCTAAVRMHLAASMPAMPGILHAAACGVASGHATAYLWVPPLAAALDQLDGPQLSQVLLALRESLRIIDSSVAAQNMVDRIMADANPELSLGIIHLTTALARNASKLQAAFTPLSTLPMLESGIYRAAASMTCNHKDLSSASLSCVASIIEICNLQDTDATAIVIRAGPSIVQGLLAALLAVSAVSRVHKVCGTFIELTGIQHPEGQSTADSIVDWLHSAIQQLPRGEMTKLSALVVRLCCTNLEVQQCIVPCNSAISLHSYTNLY